MQVNWIVGVHFLSIVVAQMQCQDGAVFTMYDSSGHNDESYPVFEPDTIQLVPFRDLGYDRLHWNAAFTSYHKAVVKRNSYRLHAFCHTTFIKNGVEKIVFQFAFEKNLSDIQYLSIGRFTPTPQKWPKIGSQHLLARIDFNNSIGGSIELDFNIRDIDISGRFSCSSVLRSGKVLKSNVFDVKDIRKSIAVLSHPSLVQPTKFYKFGVSKLSPVKETQMKMVEELSKIKSFFVSWDIGILDKTILSATKMSVSRALFDAVNYLTPRTLGQYFIDTIGNLYINWESEKAKILYEILKTEGDFKYNRKKVLMLVDDSHFVGKKFHAKPDKNGWLNYTGTPLPQRLLPIEEINIFQTYTGNLDHILQCGFLANPTKNDSTFFVQWSFNNRALDEATMLKEFGVKIMDNKAGSTLNFRGVKLGASGNWSCQLIENKTPVVGMKATYMMKTVKFPSFGEYDSSKKRFLGKPPPLVFAMEGSTVKVNCTIAGFDSNGQPVEPMFLVDGVPLAKLCQKASSAENKQNCSENIEVTNIPISSKTLAYYTRSKQYKVSDLLAMNYMLTCVGQGNYQLNPNSKISSVVKVDTATSIIVVPLPRKSIFKAAPESCSRDKICDAANATVFRCILSETYTNLLKTNGVLLEKYWKIAIKTKGIPRSKIVANLIRVQSIMKIGKNNDTVTIKNVTGKDLDFFNKNVIAVKCVVNLYYQKMIDSLQLNNLQVNCSGCSKSKDSTSPRYGPMIYSSDLDFYTARQLEAKVKLISREKKPETTTTTTITTTKRTKTTAFVKPTDVGYEWNLITSSSPIVVPSASSDTALYIILAIVVVILLVNLGLVVVYRRRLSRKGGYSPAPETEAKDPIIEGGVVTLA